MNVSGIYIFSSYFLNQNLSETKRKSWIDSNSQGPRISDFCTEEQIKWVFDHGGEASDLKSEIPVSPLRQGYEFL